MSEQDALVSLLDRISDREGRGMKKALTEAAIAGLDSADGMLRSSSARFLGVARPGVALELLPERLDREQNRMVRAMMKSALESAALGGCPRCQAIAHPKSPNESPQP